MSLRLLAIAHMKPEPATGCDQARLQEERVEPQPTHITFNPQSALPIGCAGISKGGLEIRAMANQLLV